MSDAGGDDRSPAILVVSTDPDARDLLSSEISKRYGVDYVISTHADRDDLVRRVEALKVERRPIALTVSTFGDDDPAGLGGLDRFRGLDPTAKRAVALPWADFAC